MYNPFVLINRLVYSSNKRLKFYTIKSPIYIYSCDVPFIFDPQPTSSFGLIESQPKKCSNVGRHKRSHNCDISHPYRSNHMA